MDHRHDVTLRSLADPGGVNFGGAGPSGAVFTVTRTSFLIAGAAAVAWTLAVGASGQKPAASSQVQTTSQAPGGQIPAFRSRITLVPLDVRVIGLDGRPVTGLTRDDFTIVENSERQTIAYFDAYGLAPEAPGVPTRPALRQRAGGPPTPQHGRTFLIVLGRGRIQKPFNGIGAAVQFARERLLPQDYVAVMAYNRATDFTTDHERIVSVLKRFDARHEMIEALLRQHESGPAPSYKKCRGCLPDFIIPKINEIFLYPGAPVSRELPQALGEGEDIFGTARRFYDAIVESELARGRQEPALVDAANERRAELTGATSSSDYLAGRLVANQDSDKLLNGINLMRYLDGEKHLIFLADKGLSPTTADESQIIARAAADARIALHAVITGGIPATTIVGRVSSGVPREGATDTSFPLVPDYDFSFGQTMKSLAQETGGVSSLFKYPSEGMARIDDATRSGYLVAYYPTSTATDGKFRHTEVRVNRPDVRVLVRSGYYADDVIVPSDTAAFVAFHRIADVGRYPDNVTDLKITLKASQAKSADPKKPGDVIATLRIDVSRVGFEVVNGRHAATLDVRVYCGDSHEKALGQRADTIRLNLTDETFRRYLREGFPFSARVAVSAAPRQVKAIVYDASSDLIGSMATQIK